MPTIWDVSGPEPENGLGFVSAGHFGSAVLDSDTGVVLHVAICEPCLRAGAERVQTYHEFRELRCEDIIVGREYPESEPMPYTEGHLRPEVVDIEVEELQGPRAGARRVDWYQAAMTRAVEVRKANDREIGRRARKARRDADRAAPGAQVTPLPARVVPPAPQAPEPSAEDREERAAR